MRIGIPVWEGKVSPVFDTASRLLVLDLKGGKETDRFETVLAENDVGRRCSRVQSMGVDLLICGAISKAYSNMLAASGVRVIPWISGPADEVLAAYMAGNLFSPRFFMPGCDPEQMKEISRQIRDRGES